MDSETINIADFLCSSEQDDTLYFQAYLHEQTGEILWNTNLDHTAVSGAFFKLTPWKDGLLALCWAGNEWAASPWDFDWNFVLIKPENNFQSASIPMANIIDSIPDKFRQVMPYYQYGQLPVLRLLRRYGHVEYAYELALQCPILFLMITEKQSVLADEEITELFCCKYRVILKRLGYVGTKAAVRFLKRINLPNITCDDLGTINAILRDEKLLGKLRHYPEIVRGHLQAVDKCQEIFSLRVFNRVRRKDKDGLEGFSLRVNTFIDIYEDIIALAKMAESSCQHQLTRLKTFADLQRLHDNLVRIVNKQQDFNMVLMEFGDIFPPSPISGNKHIEPIKTVSELAQEGRDMCHCAVTRARSVFAAEGKRYIYKIFEPERATAEVVMRNGKQQLYSLKLANNEEPSPATYEAVNTWLNNSLPDRR